MIFKLFFIRDDADNEATKKVHKDITIPRAYSAVLFLVMFALPVVVAVTTTVAVAETVRAVSAYVWMTDDLNKLLKNRCGKLVYYLE